MTVAYETSDEDDVICDRCDRPLPTGYQVAETLEALAGAVPVVTIVCVYCALDA